ncbi:MAG: transcriptional regulator [Gammaproteobacteria bacterium]|nr:transcriptional regulator [Gammaproteobacteria bacterium]
MQHYTRRMVTIVTESALERTLVAELESLGVRGFTITDARGKGSRGLRQSDWAQEGNIRVEVICDPAVADNIAERVRAKFYDHYAMILFLQDVSVLRSDKF